MSDPAPSEALEAASNAQAKAANPNASAFARANAGSGKTKVLIDRVARLLLQRPDGRPGAKPDSILCITYTRAAASEMLTRLFKTLGDWAVMEDARLRLTLSKLEQTKPETYSQEQLKAARALFARALETPGGLRIETIHAFCARILRRFPLEAGVVPGFVELEDEDAREMWQRAKRASILEAAAHDPEALALIAREAGREGASSALDTVRVAGGTLRAFVSIYGPELSGIEQALRSVIKPPSRSAAEIIERAIRTDFPLISAQQAIGALEGGAKTDLKLAEQLRGVLATSDLRTAFDLYTGVFLTAKGEARKRSPFTAAVGKKYPVLAELFAMGDDPGAETLRMEILISDLKHAEAFERTLALLKIGVPALEAYAEEKARRGALDFDDLIERTRDLLQTDGLASWVLYKLDGGLSHLLLDEAQDTSPAQWDLIRALTQEFNAGAGVERLQEPRTTFMVGDEKQSIYSFQGADPARFLSETQALTLRDPKAAHADMRMSFRSSPEILNFVDTVWNSAPVIDTPDAPSPPMTANEIVHTAKRLDEPGFVEIWPVMPKDPAPEADAWERPVDALRITAPKVKLAREIAKGIKLMVTGGASVWTEEHTRRPAQPGDVLILVRERRGGLFEAIINALKSAGVPVAGADRLQLADYIGVQDCLNLMRFAVLPTRDLTLAEILRGPFCGLIDDDRYLFNLAAGRAKGETLWSRVLASDDPDVIRIRPFLEGLVAQAAQPPFEFLSAVLDVPDAVDVTGWEKLNARLGTPARDPVEALLARALAHDASGPSSLQRFVAEMESTPAEIKRDLAEAAGEVRVMTVHGAKGLQAPIVILPDTTAKPKLTSEAILDVGDAVIWAPRQDADIDVSARARALAKAKAEEEHRRLLYVALTRAQDRLLIAGYWYGGQGETATGYHPGSWYALCRGAMDHLSSQVREDGCVSFGNPLPASAASAAVPTTGAPLPDWARRAPESDPAARTLSAPSGLLGPKTRVLAPFDPKREARLKRGRLIHSLLQYLPELPPASRSAAGAAFLARETAFTAAQRREMLKAAESILNDPDFSELFQPGSRAEAAVIGTSDKLPNGMVINGRVDRLVVTPERVLVIDFKTDQPAPDDVSGVAESYIVQMAAYCAVLESAYPGRDIGAVLCWTDGPRMMRIPDAMLSESLKSVLRVV